MGMEIFAGTGGDGMEVPWGWKWNWMGTDIKSAGTNADGCTLCPRAGL